MFVLQTSDLLEKLALISLQTQFAKIKNKKVMIENQCKKQAKIEFIVLEHYYMTQESTFF